MFEAAWLLTVVPLDVTMRTLMTEDDRQTLLAAGGIAAYVGRIVDFYMEFFAQQAFGTRSSCMHDVLAVAVAAGTLVPTLMPTVRATVDTGEGPGFGQTVFDLRGRYQGFPAQLGAHCRVVLDCDTTFATPVVELLCAAGESRIGTRSWLTPASTACASPSSAAPRASGRRSPSCCASAGHRVVVVDQNPAADVVADIGVPEDCTRAMDGGDRRARRPRRPRDHRRADRLRADRRDRRRALGAHPARQPDRRRAC